MCEGYLEEEVRVIAVAVQGETLAVLETPAVGRGE